MLVASTPPHTRLPPDWVLLECGGEGDCLYATLAVALRSLGHAHTTAASLRRDVASCLRSAQALVASTLASHPDAATVCSTTPPDRLAATLTSVPDLAIQDVVAAFDVFNHVRALHDPEGRDNADAVFEAAVGSALRAGAWGGHLELELLCRRHGLCPSILTDSGAPYCTMPCDAMQRGTRRVVLHYVDQCHFMLYGRLVGTRLPGHAVYRVVHDAAPGAAAGAGGTASPPPGAGAGAGAGAG